MQKCKKRSPKKVVIVKRQYGEKKPWNGYVKVDGELYEICNCKPIKDIPKFQFGNEVPYDYDTYNERHPIDLMRYGAWIVSAHKVGKRELNKLDRYNPKWMGITPAYSGMPAL